MANSKTDTMKEINKPNDQFVELVRQLYSVEKMLTMSMPAMLKAVEHRGLQKNIALHLAETDQHKEALAAIAKQLDFEVEGSDSQDLKSILEAGEHAFGGLSPGNDRDAKIIRSAIQVEEYEMKKYEELAGISRNLGYEGITRRLLLTFEEERQTNTKLHFLYKTLVAESAAIGEVPIQ